MEASSNENTSKDPYQDRYLINNRYRIEAAVQKLLFGIYVNARNDQLLGRKFSLKRTNLAYDEIMRIMDQIHRQPRKLQRKKDSLKRVTLDMNVEELGDVDNNNWTLVQHVVKYWH